jgi:hypothetical protein
MKTIFLFIIIFSLASYSQNMPKQIENNSYFTKISNGAIVADLNRIAESGNFLDYSGLYGNIDIFGITNYNKNGQVISVESFDHKIVKKYNNKNQLEFEISKSLDSNALPDTTVYVYNAFDSIEYVYSLPLPAKSTYYFDKNNRVIPSYKYNFMEHEARIISLIRARKYNYSLKTNQLRSIIGGLYQFDELNNKIEDKIFEPESEIIFSYHENGKIKTIKTAFKSFQIVEEYSIDGNQMKSIYYPSDRNNPQSVFIYTYSSGILIAKEFKSFPYHNYPDGIVSQHYTDKFEYNATGELVKHTYTDILKTTKNIYDFIYKYDEKKMWIEKIVNINNVPTFIEIRKISYFD